MRSRTSLAAAAAILAVAAFPAGSSAQTAQPAALHLSPTYRSFTGDGGLDAAVGGEAQYRITPGALSWGFGAHFGAHRTPTGDGLLLGAFVEPRRVLDAGSEAWAPYLAARVGFARLTIDVDNPDDAAESPEESHSGWAAAAGGGILLKLGGKANLDLGIAYGALGLSDMETDDTQFFSAQVGLVLGLGG